MKENIVKTKSFDYALNIICVYKALVTDKKEFTLSKQLLRSGTAVGALIREGEQAESKKDFIHKLAISLKEANESEYWIELLHKSGFISDANYNNLFSQNKELIRLLTAI